MEYNHGPMERRSEIRCPEGSSISCLAQLMSATQLTLLYKAWKLNVDGHYDDNDDYA